MQTTFTRIKKHEGYRKRVYKDSLDKDTIGYGFLISALELDKDICDIILMRKIWAIEDKLYPEIYRYPKIVKIVLVEMAYQLGVKGLMAFEKTLEYAKQRNWKKMSVEMLDSEWAEQTPDRAKELSDIIRSVE